MFPIRDTNKSNTFPIVNWIIIVINASIFFVQVRLPRETVEIVYSTFGVVPIRFTELHLLAPISLFSSQFLHGGWLHIIRNLWILYIFGDNVEDRMGHIQYLVFYLMTGVIGGLLQVITQPFSTIPIIGASGAISGVLGAYILFFPRARVLTFVPIFILPWLVEIPAVIFLGVWFLSQFVNVINEASAVISSGVAYWAHLGGFGAGFLLARRIRKIRNISFKYYN
ncbi:MAG: rhomboid family intramembrane serine protease [Anaerolineaceae bacterium]|nr:rhomboid family intramembrane serine protease [Anaerolineaceae bacterium]HCU80355.1 rhomboid family intramembrane serine protease [Chloroflexota bacterium]|tara:strand:+ start:705 stop:1379 length:675 start_codon:yes stop_codon:yes gene_type:complete